MSWLHRDWCLRPSDPELVDEYELETNHNATATDNITSRRLRLAR